MPVTVNGPVEDSGCAIRTATHCYACPDSRSCTHTIDQVASTEARSSSKCGANGYSEWRTLKVLTIASIKDTEWSMRKQKQSHARLPLRALKFARPYTSTCMPALFHTIPITSTALARIHTTGLSASVFRPQQACLRNMKELNFESYQSYVTSRHPRPCVGSTGRQTKQYALAATRRVHA